MIYQYAHEALIRVRFLSKFSFGKAFLHLAGTIHV